ncbi:MAG: flagellar biosynthesis protein FlgG [Deltaproteobacteria bacterium]|jgi:flagellar hook protein FlgE|nr:flagellar biosynthesis protein FlgG [Deltaproteobacteria bacterium]
MSVIGAMHASSAALHSFGIGTQVIAHNLANVLTDGFKASRALYYDLPARSGAGVVTQKPNAPLGPLVPVQGLPPEMSGNVLPGFLEMSNTDVAVEFVNMIVTSRAYQANAKVIPAADEMLGTIINLRG